MASRSCRVSYPPELYASICESDLFFAGGVRSRACRMHTCVNAAKNLTQSATTLAYWQRNVSIQIPPAPGFGRRIVRAARLHAVGCRERRPSLPRQLLCVSRTERRPTARRRSGSRKIQARQFRRRNRGHHHPRHPGYGHAARQFQRIAGAHHRRLPAYHGGFIECRSHRGRPGARERNFRGQRPMHELPSRA